jgi:HlyD family secretion protein
MRKWIVMALAVATGCRREPGDAIEATGTLEVVEVNVSATVPARIAKINVLEGQLVKAGDTLAMLAQPTLPSEERQREARARGARALRQEMERGTRPAEMQRAEAELAAAEAEASRTARDAERLRGLADRQVVSAQQYDAARSLAATTASRRDALASNLRLLREGASDERIRAARAESEAADANTETVRATERDLVLRSPVTGIISSRNVEPGEVVVAGTPVVTVSETSRQTVRVFVSQAAISRINPGQTVRGTLDAYPDREFAGRVATIATKAEFTPRVALTERERNDLLFAVKVEFADSTGMLKAGLPITVRIAAPGPSAAASKSP